MRGSVLIGTFVNNTFASTPNMVADVQFWLNNPANNFGWLLQGESENIPRSIRRFSSRKDLARYPQLTIQYTTIPEPGAASILILGLAALACKSWAWRT